MYRVMDRHEMYDEWWVGRFMYRVMDRHEMYDEWSVGRFMHRVMDRHEMYDEWWVGRSVGLCTGLWIAMKCMMSGGWVGRSARVVP
jgi:hypothetical protein